MTDTNSRFRAGEVAAELRAINTRLDQLMELTKGIQDWRMDVIGYMSSSGERIEGLRRDMEKSDRLVGTVGTIIAAVFSSIAGWWGSSR